MPQSNSSFQTANVQDVPQDAYVVIGVSTCFVKSDGEVRAVNLLEPVPSAYLEVLLKGVPTSYRGLYAAQLTELIQNGGVQVPDAQLFQAHQPLQLCDDFIERMVAAARTYQANPQLQSHLPVGTTLEDINFSTEKKRILDGARVVSDDDNVRQHAYTHQKL